MKTRPWILIFILLIALPCLARAGDKKGRTDWGPHPTIDEFTKEVTVEETESGGTITMRVFYEPIPWDLYKAAVDAEENDRFFPGGKLTQTYGTATPANACVPPDTDYDGDGLIGAADPRPWVAERPIVRTEFPIDITPYLDVELTLTEDIVEENKKFDSDSTTTTHTVNDTLEMKRVFNSTLGLKLKFGIKKLIPSFSLESAGLDNTLTFTRTSTTKWTDNTTQTVKSEFSSTYTETLRGTKRIVSDSGGVRTNILVINDSDPIDGHPTNIEVSEIRLSFIVIHPLTGAVNSVGEMTINETFQLFEGFPLDTYTKFVDRDGLSAHFMLEWLRQGYIFDIALASHPVATNMATGVDIRQTLSEVNSKTVQYSILFGEQDVDREYGAVSKWAEGGGCLTGRQLLEAAVGPENVEFGQHEDGSLILTRIFDYPNIGDDFDQTACEADPGSFARWIVGYKYESNTGQGPIDLENTILAAQDMVFFYRVTCADLMETHAVPDFEVQDASVRNDDPAQEQLDSVFDLLEGDRVQLIVENTIQTERVISQYSGASRYCSLDPYANRILYDVTNYYLQPHLNSGTHDIPELDPIDEYGLEVRFRDGPWLDMAALLSVPNINARILGPDDPRLPEPLAQHEYAIEFTVVDALFNNQSHGEIDIRANAPRERHTIGFTGRNIQGTPDQCWWTADGVNSYIENVVGLRIFRFSPDEDEDLFFPGFADFDDTDPMRFLFAPELLDGIDNDGDGDVDEEPLICPSRLYAGQSAVCILDDRMGWYGDTLYTEMTVRTHYEDGSTGSWGFLGGPDDVTVTMPTDLTVGKIEIFTTNWVDLPAHGGSNFIEQIDPNDPVVRMVGEDIEAEDGVVIHPMVVDSDNTGVYVHTPQGTSDTTGAKAEFLVQITTPGDYEIWTDVYATNSTDDSFLVDVLDTSGQLLDFGFGPGAAHFRLEASDPPYQYGSWDWTRVGHWNVYVNPEQRMNPVVYSLTSGVHTIRFRPRELGTRLDKLRVDRVCYDNDGDGVTDCAGDCNDGNAQVYPGRGESCATSYDDDCDGVAQEGCNGGGCRKKCVIEQY